MREIIGVKAYYGLPNAELIYSLKKEALFFNRIALRGLSSTSNMLRDDPILKLDERVLDEIEWLYDQGFLFDVELDADHRLADNKEFEKYQTFHQVIVKKQQESLDKDIEAVQSELAQIEAEFHEILNSNSELFSNEFKAYLKTIDNISELPYVEALKLLGYEGSQANVLDKNNPDENSIKAEEYWARAVSIQLRELNSLDAYPLLSGMSYSAQESLIEKSQVVQIVVNNLPTPQDSVSWEQIMDFRNDPDTLGNSLAIRNWMSEVARAKLSPSEVEEKLEYLIYQYKQHIQLHRLKTNVGTLETLVVAGAEFLENLAKFNLGNIAKSLFSLRHRKIALIEGELSSPGHEVAYIERVRRTFS